MIRPQSISSLGLVFSLAACSGVNVPDPSGNTGGAGAGSGSAGKSAAGALGGGGDPTSGGRGAAGATGGSGASSGSASSGGTAGAVGACCSTGGRASGAGATGGAGSAGAQETSGGAGTGTAGMGAAGMGAAGTAGAPPVTLPPLVTSADGAYWNTSAALTDATASANVTVNDTSPAQTWDGFGGAFNELGWSYLTTKDMQDQAMTLLFSASDGAALAWGRIPIGASDYAVSRYTDDDTGTDVTATSNESNRPPEDASLSQFSLDRDAQKLIPYIQAAQAKNPKLRFWASPWTPPVWMKTGYKTNSGADGTSAAKKPSYFDGGNMKSSATDLAAYAQYYTRFVSGYKAQGIAIEVVSPQNEPGYDQNYPSCLWDKTTYVSWIGQYLGPAMKAIGVNVMLGTLSNAGDSGRSDVDLANAVLADPTATSFVSVVGAQWGVLDWIDDGMTKLGSLPVWATEHKCGNYPWCTSNSNGCPSAYNASEAPNDQAYAEESWYYLRDAITKGKVTAYNAWNMVLDKIGLGIDTTRDWKQNALLVAEAGKVNPTPAYYVFRHFSQYVAPGATVVGTTGGDAVAFKNPDGSLVAVMFNGGAANGSYVVALGGKKFQFAMPSHGWATVKYKP
jgi:glucosylceramidase